MKTRKLILCGAICVLALIYALQLIISGRNPIKTYALDKDFDTITLESVANGTVTLTKDTWGYVQLGCEAEGDFVKPGARVIWTDDFEGNICKLKFEIDKEKLRPGRNFGALRLSSLRAETVIEVKCRNESAKRRTLLI